MGEETGDVAHASMRASDRLDNLLNVVLGFLLSAVLVFCAYFGYAVWRERQLQVSATPALRLIEATKAEVRGNPNDANLRVRLGEAFGSAGKFREAIAQFNAALKIEPNHTGAYLDLGVVAIAQKDYSAAEHYLQKVVDLTGQSEFAEVNNRRELALYNLGLLALHDSRFEDAVGFFKEALRVRKDASDTYYNLALAYQGLEEYDAALEQLDNALAFDPNFAQAHFLMGELYMQQDDEINAAVHFRIAAQKAPDADPPQEALASLGTAAERIAAGQKALEADDFDKALHEALVARALEPGNLDAALLHGRILVKRGDNQAALEVYKEALKIQKDNPEATAEIKRLSDLLKG